MTRRRAETEQVGIQQKLEQEVEQEVLSREQIQKQINDFESFLSQNGYELEKLTNSRIFVGKLNVDIIEQFYKNNLNSENPISINQLSHTLSNWIEALTNAKEQNKSLELMIRSFRLLYIFLIYKELPSRREDIIKAIDLKSGVPAWKKENLAPKTASPEEKFSREQIQKQIAEFKDFLAKNGYDYDKMVKTGVLESGFDVDEIMQITRQQFSAQLSKISETLANAASEGKTTVDGYAMIKSSIPSILFLFYREAPNDRSPIFQLLLMICGLLGLKIEDLAPENKPSEEIISLKQIQFHEKKAWKAVLGIDLEVPPLPPEVTPEVKKSLESFGFELRYIPKLDIGSLSELKQNGAEKFLDRIQNLCPKWRKYESLSRKQRLNHSIARNLEKWFWELAEYGDMNFPQLPGNWVAVETMPKPSRGKAYDKTLVSELLGREDRFGATWNNAYEAIETHKSDLLEMIGLSSSKRVRMLEAVEWNLLANREGWGSTNTFEWTNTETRNNNGLHHRIVVGRFDQNNVSRGGAACAGWFRPSTSENYLGFRIAIVF
jgi:hypothetical protein